MRVIVQIEQGRGRKIKRMKEDRDQKSKTGSEVRWWLPEVSKDTDICLIEKER